MVDFLPDELRVPPTVTFPRFLHVEESAFPDIEEATGLRIKGVGVASEFFWKPDRNGA